MTCAFEKKGRKSKMIFLEIVMIVIGLGAIIYSTKITDGAESSDIKSVVDWQDQMEQLRHKIEQFNEEITRKQEEKLEDTSEKMNTISNEKIMGISEYSDQVIDKIEKNHAEVVFLYDMLNEKQAEIQKLIHEADSSKVQFQDVKEALLAADIEWFSYYLELEESLQQMVDAVVVERLVAVRQ